MASAYLVLGSPQESGAWSPRWGCFASLHAPGDFLSTAVLDESNAFTSMEVPEWTWAWQAAPPVLAGLVWEVLLGEVRETARASDGIRPLWRRLLMGDPAASTS
eukprot:3428826-Pyramimonas_sp.AAC.1